jgi:hypothetical protein
MLQKYSPAHPALRVKHKNHTTLQFCISLTCSETMEPYNCRCSMEPYYYKTWGNAAIFLQKVKQQSHMIAEGRTMEPYDWRKWDNGVILLLKVRQWSHMTVEGEPMEPYIFLLILQPHSITIYAVSIKSFNKLSSPETSWAINATSVSDAWHIIISNVRQQVQSLFQNNSST